MLFRSEAIKIKRGESYRFNIKGKTLSPINTVTSESPDSGTVIHEKFFIGKSSYAPGIAGIYKLTKLETSNLKKLAKIIDMDFSHSPVKLMVIKKSTHLSFSIDISPDGSPSAINGYCRSSTRANLRSTSWKTSRRGLSLCSGGRRLSWFWGS